MTEQAPTPGERYGVCSECEAVGHGNLTCPTCIAVINERRAQDGLEPIPRFGTKTIRPVGADEVTRFAARLNGGQP